MTGSAPMAKRENGAHFSVSRNPERTTKKPEYRNQGRQEMLKDIRFARNQNAD